MKDFKKMPKMVCGGGVKKMQAGGRFSDDIAEAFRSGKAKPAPMPSDKGNRDYGFDVPGMGRVKPIEMPSDKGNRDYGFDVPGMGRVKPIETPRKTIHEAMLLKKGGKVKRGNKKK
jgi:hypothetical protein